MICTTNTHVGRPGLLRRVAIKSVVAVLPVAMVGAFASNLFVPTPPRLAAYDVQPVAEISVTSSTVGLADSSLYFLTDPTYTIVPAKVAKHLDEMQALGIDNVRVYVPWKYVEATRDQYDWSSMDVIMNLAAARNMGVLAATNTTPDWVVPGVSDGAAHPDPADFRDFMRALATRYGTTVSAYEIWNEPNYQLYYDPIDPTAYTDLLKSVYPALKAIDPTATIVAAGLGHSPTRGDEALSPVTFLEGMYAAGAKGYFDALAYHPYQESTPFSQSTPDGYALNQALAMVALMGSAGDYVTGANGQPLRDANGRPITKKIWATEYGLPTSRVTYAHQAAYIKDFLTTWAKQSWAGPAYVYTTVDSNPGSNDAEENYGIYTVDAQGNWVRKPAAQVLAEWIVAHPNQTFDPTKQTATGNPLRGMVAFVNRLIQRVVKGPQSFLGPFVTAVTKFLRALTRPAVVKAVSSPRVASVEAPQPDSLAASTVDARAAASAKEDNAVSKPAVSEPAVSEQAVSEHLKTASSGDESTVGDRDDITPKAPDSKDEDATPTDTETKDETKATDSTGTDPNASNTTSPNDTSSSAPKSTPDREPASANSGAGADG